MEDYSGYDRIEDFAKYSKNILMQNQLLHEGVDILIDNVSTRGIIRNDQNPMSETKEDRSFIVDINIDIKTGNYITYENINYMIITGIDIYKDYYKKCKIRECNQTLFLKGWDKPIPCFVTNDSYGNKLLLDSDILSMSDEKCKITIQDNQFTRKILKNTRFMFEHSEHGIFKVFSIDVVYQKGLITLICKKDTYKEGIDDLEHNVAGQVDMVEDTMPKDDLVIYGSETIKLGSIEEYTIQSSVAIAWSIDNSSVCTMTEQGKNYCKLKALRRDEVCILTAKINSTIVYQKMITTTR